MNHYAVCCFRWYYWYRNNRDTWFHLGFHRHGCWLWRCHWKRLRRDATVHRHSCHGYRPIVDQRTHDPKRWYFGSVVGIATADPKIPKTANHNMLKYFCMKKLVGLDLVCLRVLLTESCSPSLIHQVLYTEFFTLSSECPLGSDKFSIRMDF